MDEWIRVGVEAERLGYWSYWTTEHHFASDRNYHPYGTTDDEYPITDYDMAADPFLLLTYLAAKTKTLRLGTAVSILHWDHPIRIVERAAMLDVLSGGRLELGVGRGVGFRETQVFGVPTDPATNSRRYYEAVEILRRAWSGEEFSFDGEFYQVPPITVTPQPERQPIPIWMGSASDDSAAFAGREGLPYATVTWPLTGMKNYKHKKEVYEEAAAEAGQDIAQHSIPHYLYTYCAESEQEAAEMGYKHMIQFQYIVEAHYEFGRKHEENKLGHNADIRHQLDELARHPVEHHMIGTPAQLIERLHEFKREVDLNYLVLNVHYGGMPLEATLKSLRLFSEKVMPHFADDRSPALAS
jgi:alkanesulfonate monooxygenase SsuD/methylene tetrahydromethanopterin reductase-like flavin-dependent oxidoreductase (luciferase family)